MGQKKGAECEAITAICKRFRVVFHGHQVCLTPICPLHTLRHHGRVLPSHQWHHAVMRASISIKGCVVTFTCYFTARCRCVDLSFAFGGCFQVFEVRVRMRSPLAKTFLEGQTKRQRMPNHYTCCKSLGVVKIENGHDGNKTTGEIKKLRKIFD